MFNNLLSLLNSIIPLSDKLKSRLTEILCVESFPRKHLLLKEGQICNHIYFIDRGFVRSYHLKDDKEITNWFMKENDMIISVSSFFKREPSFEYLQLLEDSTFCSIHFDELQNLYLEFPEFNVIGRVLVEKYYVLSEERVTSMRKQKAEDRLHFLTDKYPEIMQRASLGHIATYLGISSETMSRIRSKK